MLPSPKGHGEDSDRLPGPHHCKRHSYKGAGWTHWVPAAHGAMGQEGCPGKGPCRGQEMDRALGRRQGMPHRHRGERAPLHPERRCVKRSKLCRWDSDPAGRVTEI